MLPDDRIRAVALALTDRVGWKLIQRLLEPCGSLEAILAATSDELQTVRGIGNQIATNIRQIDPGKMADELTCFDEQGIKTVTWLDERYPSVLHHLDDKPLVIFSQGVHFPGEIVQTVAIVGTREPSELSREFAYGWAAAFARRGWTVISGLARGVDTAAHQGALDGGGRSFAILGCGVNVTYPPENGDLARRIGVNGALISEVHPETGVSPPALRLRNRLITALSCATIVIEAGETSGALHSSRYARQQSRPVFALPNSAGNIALLDRGEAALLPDDPSDVERVIERF